MQEPFEDSRFDHNDGADTDAAKLTWALLDGDISEQDTSRLVQLLNENEAARAEYLDRMCLHFDLQDYFANHSPADDPPATSEISPVLGFLGSVMPIDGSVPTNRL